MSIIADKRRFKVAVTGGRTYLNREVVFGVLDAVNYFTPITTLIHGGAKGADYLAGTWALHKRITVRPYPVIEEEWEQYGLAAGPRRNRMMLAGEGPDLLIAFPGKKGTASCVAIAKELGIEVLTIGGM